MNVRYLLLALVAVMAIVIAGVVKAQAQTTAVLGFGTLAVLSLLQMIQAVGVAEKVAIADKHTTEIADKIPQVDAKIDKLAEVAKATHILVNNKMQIQLQLTSDLATRLAQLPGATNADKLLADDAALKLREHKDRQFLVDHPKEN